VIAALHAESAAKETYILGLTTELQEIVGYVDQLQQEEVRIAGALRTADPEVRSRDGVSNLAQQLEVLQDYQNRNAGRIAALKAQIDDHQGERADWAKAERALLNQIEILNNRVHLEAERHATEIDRLRREIRGYQGEIREHKERIELVEGELEQTRKELVVANNRVIEKVGYYTVGMRKELLRSGIIVPARRGKLVSRLMKDFALTDQIEQFSDRFTEIRPGSIEEIPLGGVRGRIRVVPDRSLRTFEIQERDDGRFLVILDSKAFWESSHAVILVN